MRDRSVSTAVSLTRQSPKRGSEGNSTAGGTDTCFVSGTDGKSCRGFLLPCKSRAHASGLHWKVGHLTEGSVISRGQDKHKINISIKFTWHLYFSVMTSHE